MTSVAATVRVGTPLDIARPAPEAARELEELGFDYASTGEHVAFHSPVANGFVTLAAAAGATSRIGVLSAITILPLYPPVLAAKLTAELCRHSGGRFALGVGVGGEYPAEFEALGVPVRQRGSRTNEALEILHRLLRESDVSYAGRFTQFSGLTIDPRPSAPPEIWVGGRKGLAIDRAARHADVWLPHFFSPEMVADSLGEVRRRAFEHGRDPEAISGAVQLWTTVDETRDNARAAAVTQLSAIYGMDMSAAVDRYTLFGTPDDCELRLRAYYAAGVRRFILSPLHAEAGRRAKMIETIAAELLPIARQLAE